MTGFGEAGRWSSSALATSAKRLPPAAAAEGDTAVGGGRLLPAPPTGGAGCRPPRVSEQDTRTPYRAPWGPRAPRAPSQVPWLYLLGSSPPPLTPMTLSRPRTRWPRDDCGGGLIAVYGSSGRGSLPKGPPVVHRLIGAGSGESCRGVPSTVLFRRCEGSARDSQRLYLPSQNISWCESLHGWHTAQVQP